MLISRRVITGMFVTKMVGVLLGVLTSGILWYLKSVQPQQQTDEKCWIVWRPGSVQYYYLKYLK